MLTTSIDQRRLDSMIQGVYNALIGTGADASEVVKDESRLLALQIMKVAQPRDRKKTGDRIASSIKSRFTELGDGFDKELSSQTGEANWYRADSKFLYGVSPDLDMRGANADTLAEIYYAAHNIGGKTRIVNDFNPARPSGQRKAILAKVLARKSDINRLVTLAKTAIGKLPASWFATARQIDSSASAPQWIARHLKGNQTTKSITDLTGLRNSDSPSAAFGSKAVGVAKFNRAIQFAVNLRAKKLLARLRLILSGYSRDVSEGIKARRQSKRIKGDE